MRYTCDPAKLAANVAKHGIWFTAAEDFDWETAVVEVVHRNGEARLMALGLIGERVHVMVVTLRETCVRIISLRKASKKEVRFYAETQD
ncbi:BrnT family toxin [Xylophilus rhododendri]|uniref:BrnT family toxin n=2 Tax=Xylophilus rhododendri TaxID=2697032 RepID=A0A857JE16_9BURK|nr:BrnT family toxin [Xylophilus rhododendri]